MNCPLCGFEDWAYSFTVDTVPVRRCRNCGLSRAVLSRERGPANAVPADPAPPAAPGDDSRVDQAIETFLCALETSGNGPSRLLLLVDVGVSLPAISTRSGLAIEAFDASTVDGKTLPPGRFQAAIVVGQLERSSNPIQLLETIHDALDARGSLLVVIPVAGGWSRGVLHDWRLRGPGQYLYCFNAETLESALLRSGFSQVEMADGRTGKPGRVLAARARPAIRRPRPVLSIIVPAYNEKNTINDTMSALVGKVVRGVDKEIVVVESNSTDGTREAVLAYQHQPGVRVVFEDRPDGKGHAVRTALQHITGDVVLIQDADSEYDFDDYDDLLKPLLTYRKPFVLGSRHTAGWKIRSFDAEPQLATWLNFGHYFFVALLNTIYRQRLKDPFTMYKVFRRDCIHGLTFECNRFDFDFEFVIKMIRKGYTPIEIPVNYNARSWAEGKKVRLIRDPLTWIRALVKYRFVRVM